MIHRPWRAVLVSCLAACIATAACSSSNDSGAKDAGADSATGAGDGGGGDAQGAADTGTQRDASASDAAPCTPSSSSAAVKACMVEKCADVVTACNADTACKTALTSVSCGDQSAAIAPSFKQVLCDCLATVCSDKLAPGSLDAIRGLGVCNADGGDAASSDAASGD